MGEVTYPIEMLHVAMPYSQSGSKIPSESGTCVVRPVEAQVEAPQSLGG